MSIFGKFGRGILAVLSVVAFMGLAGCGEEGDAEKAGKKIDEATQDLKKKLGN